jgi:outer membrane protein OmpA-like peptidoglycan-associated protein
MAKKYDTVKYETTPQVLETHGGKINVSVKGNIPPKYFGKKVVVDFTPVLKWDGGSYTCKSIKIGGEKSEGSDVKINKKGGGSFTWSDVITYQPEMNSSELVVNAKATKGKKTVEFGEVKLADGVIYTSTRIGRDEDLALAEHGYKKEVIVSKTATLYFDYNSSKLYDNQKLNKLEENKKLVQELKDFIALNWKINNIEINAWASPEGEEQYNANLSNDRAAAAKKYIESYIEKLDKEIAKNQKKKYNEVKREAPLTINGKGEDFDGFMKAIEKSNLPEKQAIINVIKSQPDKAKREREIKNMSVVYAEVEAILEPLRRAEIVVSCYAPKRTDDDIARLSLTAPDSLKAEELLYAATLTDDINNKLKIYKAGTEIYPSDWKFWNNTGYILLSQHNISEATPYIEKANTLSPNNPVVLNNLGVIAAWNKQYDKAKEYYEQAKSEFDVNYNLGVLKIVEGDYAGALKLFSGKSCRYNIALAQLLSTDYTSAARTLECIPNKTPEVYYLMAIVGARTGNTSMLIDNLKQAVKDPALKSQAKTDREFLKYYNNSDFQAIIK